MPKQVNPNQINASVLGMASAVFTSLAAAIVTMAVKSNVLVEKGFNVLIHGVSAAEHIAEAAEGRAEIYGQGLVANGALAERETALKHRLRLAVLEAQEISAGSNPEADKPKPTKTAAKPAKAKDNKPKSQAQAKPVNAAHTNGAGDNA